MNTCYLLFKDFLQAKVTKVTFRNLTDIKFIFCLKCFIICMFKAYNECQMNPPKTVYFDINTLKIKMDFKIKLCSFIFFK